MKKIVPFKKDIIFSTNVYEINSISLEHNLKLSNNKNIEGEFIISGDYKDTEYSMNNEPFIFNIPADIEINSRYILDNIKIDIEDFNYDIVDSNKLCINIKLSLEGIEETPEVEEVEEVEEIIEDKVEEQEEEERCIIEEEKKEVTSLFNNIGKEDDNYINYNVHIFRENDSIENIIKLYNTSKEKLEEYNNLSSIITGSKIIIPSNE